MRKPGYEGDFEPQPSPSPLDRAFSNLTDELYRLSNTVQVLERVLSPVMGPDKLVAIGKEAGKEERISESPLGEQLIQARLHAKDIAGRIGSILDRLELAK